MNDQPEKTAAKSEDVVLIDLAEMDTVAASDKGTEIELRHPTTNKLLGMFVGVLGKDSQVFQDIVAERRNEAIRVAALAQKTGRDPEIKTAEELDTRGLELLMACTTHFRTEIRTAKGEVKEEKQAIYCDGKWLTFNVPNATTLYRRFPWMRKQVDEAIGDLSLFIKP